VLTYRSLDDASNATFLDLNNATERDVIYYTLASATVGKIINKPADAPNYGECCITTTWLGSANYLIQDYVWKTSTTFGKLSRFKNGSNSNWGNWVAQTYKGDISNATITLSAGNGLTTGGDFTLNQSSAETITLNVGAGAGISVTADAVALATSGVTAGSYGPSAAASPAHGGNFNVPYITVDTYGRVTAASNSKITLPSYSAAKYNTLGLLKPAYTTTGAVTLTTAAASNASTPTINAKTETAGRYYAVEADKNGVPFVNVP
jgi:hypothetical protein